MKPFDKHVFVCTNERPAGHPRGSCHEKGSEQLRDAFKSTLKSRGVKGAIRANAAGCLDQCEEGCVVVVYPDAVWYGHVTPADVAEIVDEHLLGGRPVTRLRIDGK